MDKEQMVFSLEFGKHSTPGLDMEIIEDGVGYFSPREEAKLVERGQLFLIADGHGRAHQGDIASQTVVKTIIGEYYEASWLDDVEQMLHNSIQKANAALYQMNVESEGHSSLSCSIICAVVHGDSLYAARVGDCHAFIVSNNRLMELLPPPGDTTAGAISQKIHEGAPASETVNRLGFDPQIDIAHVTRRIQLKDIIFLCTHNVAAAIPDDDLGILLTSAEPAIACETLTKDTIRKFPEQDATALAIRVKGIRRLSFDESDIPESLYTPETEERGTGEREIVIKGVRYRDNLGDIPPSAADETRNFIHHRERARRPLKRHTPAREKKSLPWGKIIGIPLFLAILGLLGYAIAKYVPQYWRSLTEPRQHVETITADSLKELKPQVEQQQKSTVDTTQVSAVAQEPVKRSDSTKVAAAQDTSKKLPTSLPRIVTFRVAIIDGSGMSGATNKIKSSVATIVQKDRVSYFKSKYLIRHSKILWRKSNDALKLKYVTNRLLKYSDSFTAAFGIKPEIFPLDFSLVIGSDFKVPPIRDRYMELTDEKNDYYIEILNGSKVSGLARKMSNILHHQRFDSKRLVVVDYRNADKLTYVKSFIKCEASKNDIALKMAKDFALPTLISNAPLFDIKIIIGTDVKK